MLRRIFTVLFWTVTFITAWGWRILDVIGRGDVLVNLEGILGHLQEFVVRHQEIGYQVAPWVVMVVSVLALALLQWPGLLPLRRRKKHKTKSPSADRGFDIVFFRSHDGAVQPTSTNAANVSKMAPNIFKENFVQPVDQSTICTAMSGTPSLFKYEIDATGSTATYIWPANIELPEILSVGNYKPRKL